MRKDRVALLVYVDLAGVPGTMHTEESAREVTDYILNGQISHYNPSVQIAPKELQPPPFEPFVSTENAEK